MKLHDKVMVDQPYSIQYVDFKGKSAKVLTYICFNKYTNGIEVIGRVTKLSGEYLALTKVPIKALEYRGVAVQAILETFKKRKV